MNTRYDIGNKIREIRIKKGLTVRELAELTGYDYSYISRIESGKHSIGIDILCKIADKLQAEIDIKEKGGI